jgi:hypothetical protein
MTLARLKKLIDLMGSPSGIAVLAAVSTGSLFGIALGARSWTFFAGCLVGAVLGMFAMDRLRGTTPPRVDDGAAKEASKSGTPEPYDLEGDHSTDSQRWPM